MSKREEFKASCRKRGRVIAIAMGNGPAERWTGRWRLAAAVACLPWAAAYAETPVSCGGFAMLGGAQIVCSHVLRQAPTQFCTYSWALLTTGGALSTVEGSFLLTPGASNMTIYQGAGYASALSEPIVLCQGKKSR